MTQQRQNETEEEYKRRKKRVRLVMMGGSGGTFVRPTIDYLGPLNEFKYFVDPSGNTVIDNQGSGGDTYDGLPYSGRGIELGATNDTIVGDAAKWTTWFDFADSSHHTVFGIKTFNSITTNSILVSASEPSAITLARFNNNPNLVGKLALSGTGTIPEVDLTLVASDSYYMCSEKSGAYLVDSRVAYGAEVLTNSDCSSTTGWSSTFGTIASDGNLITVTTDATLTETLIWQDNLTLNGKYAVIEIDVDTMPENYSKFEFQIRESFASATQIKALVLGSNKFIVKVPNFTVTKFIIDAYDLLATNSFKINTFSVREATATEIANYASTVRTNADLQQKGIQQTAFVTDGAGVPQSYSDNLLQFNGDGRYADTQYNPSNEESCSIEIMLSNRDLIRQLHGTEGTDGRLFVGHGNDGLIEVGIGSYYIGTIPGYTNQDIHAVIIKDGTSGKLYLNNTLVVNQTITYTNHAGTFTIGSLNGTIFQATEPVGGFKIHTKALTATEVETAYAQAKTIYPTLP